MPKQEPTGPALRVVIAEDEAIIRLDLKETLQEMGYDVVADLGTGEAALDAIREHEPDLAILDIKMGPGMTGLEVARTIAAEPGCALLILTAFSQADLISEAADAGVMNYLVKPFQRASLHPAIEIAFARFQAAEAVRLEVESLEEQLEVRKLVDRAKGALMDRQGLSEAEAYRELQQSAMSQRLPMKQIAQGILSPSSPVADRPNPG